MPKAKQELKPQHISFFGIVLMSLFLLLLVLQAGSLQVSLFTLVSGAMLPSDLPDSETSSALLKVLPCFAGVLMVVYGTMKTIEAKKNEPQAEEPQI